MKDTVHINYWMNKFNRYFSDTIYKHLNYDEREYLADPKPFYNANGNKLSPEDALEWFYGKFGENHENPEGYSKELIEDWITDRDCIIQKVAGLEGLNIYNLARFRDIMIDYGDKKHELLVERLLEISRAVDEKRKKSTYKEPEKKKRKWILRRNWTEKDWSDANYELMMGTPAIKKVLDDYNKEDE